MTAPVSDTVGGKNADLKYHWDIIVVCGGLFLQLIIIYLEKPPESYRAVLWVKIVNIIIDGRKKSPVRCILIIDMSEKYTRSIRVTDSNLIKENEETIERKSWKGKLLWKKTQRVEIPTPMNQNMQLKWYKL